MCIFADGFHKPKWLSTIKPPASIIENPCALLLVCVTSKKFLSTNQTSSSHHKEPMCTFAGGCHKPKWPSTIKPLGHYKGPMCTFADRFHKPKWPSTIKPPTAHYRGYMCTFVGRCYKPKWPSTIKPPTAIIEGPCALLLAGATSQNGYLQSSLQQAS